MAALTISCHLSVNGAKTALSCLLYFYHHHHLRKIPRRLELLLLDDVGMAVPGKCQKCTGIGALENDLILNIIS